MPAAYLKALSIEVDQQCWKIAYATRLEALRVMRRSRPDLGLTAVGIGKLNVYRCVHCRGWHVGHRY